MKTKEIQFNEYRNLFMANHKIEGQALCADNFTDYINNNYRDTKFEVQVKISNNGKTYTISMPGNMADLLIQFQKTCGGQGNELQFFCQVLADPDFAKTFNIKRENEGSKICAFPDFSIFGTLIPIDLKCNTIQQKDGKYIATDHVEGGTNSKIKDAIVTALDNWLNTDKKQNFLDYLIYSYNGPYNKELKSLDLFSTVLFDENGVQVYCPHSEILKLDKRFRYTFKPFLTSLKISKTGTDFSRTHSYNEGKIKLYHKEPNIVIVEEQTNFPAEILQMIFNWLNGKSDKSDSETNVYNYISKLI